MVYAYRWSRTLVRSSGICPKDERHLHVIKDFIASLHCITSEMKLPTNGQISKSHLILSKKLLIWPSKQKPRSRLLMVLRWNSTATSHQWISTEISADNTSSDEFKVNKVSRSKR